MFALVIFYLTVCNGLVKLLNNTSSTSVELSGSLKIILTDMMICVCPASLRLSFTLQISYEYLIVALGLQLHYEKVK